MTWQGWLVLHFAIGNIMALCYALNDYLNDIATECPIGYSRRCRDCQREYCPIRKEAADDP